MDRIRHLEGDGDEAVEVHGRADHWGAARARGGIEDQRCLSQAWDKQRDVLQVEGEVWRPDLSEARRQKVLTDENAKLKKHWRRQMLDAEGYKFKKMVTPAARRQA